MAPVRREFLFVILLIFNGVWCDNIGKFWHITDHHWDPYYSQKGEDPMDICPSSFGRMVPDAGPYGTYKCDSTWALIQSSIEAMKKINPNPDFILWTGDDPLHTERADLYLNKSKLLEIIGNISTAIADAFPTTKIYPALGNHDFYPDGQARPGESEIVTDIARIWEPWLSVEAYESFKAGGFYTELLPGSDDHLIMIINSNIWYNYNKEVNGTGDPGHEFQWMEDKLRDAAAKSQKVFIAGHIPPGYFELVSEYNRTWFYKYYNERFMQIIRNNKDVIVGMFFGHHHSDSFKVVKDEEGNIIQSMLLAPGVTPWETTLPGVVNGANNPGIRLVEYYKDTMKLKDYTQYYFDLSVANAIQSFSDPSTLWKTEYRASSEYNIPDITTSSLGSLATSMRRGCEQKDSACPDTFVKYFKMNSVSYDRGKCDETCQKFQLCAIIEIEEAGYNSCMENWGNYGAVAKPSIWCVLLVSVVSFLETWA